MRTLHYESAISMFTQRAAHSLPPLLFKISDLYGSSAKCQARMTLVSQSNFPAALAQSRST